MIVKHLFLIIACVIAGWLISLLISSKSTLDIHFHDTMFILAIKQGAWVLASIVLYLVGLYLLRSK